MHIFFFSCTFWSPFQYFPRDQAQSCPFIFQSVCKTTMYSFIWYHNFFSCKIDEIANKCQSNTKRTFPVRAPWCMNVQFGRVWDYCVVWLQLVCINLVKICSIPNKEQLFVKKVIKYPNPTAISEIKFNLKVSKWLYFKQIRHFLYERTIFFA